LVAGPNRLPMRKLVVVGGMSLWLAALLLRTDGDGVATLWAHALVGGGLLLAGSLTRTVSIRELVRFLFLGAALLGAMFLLALLVLNPLLPRGNPERDVVVPILEQAMYAAPLGVLLWLRRRGRSWSMAATDLLLLGAAVGIGFGVVEEAYLRAGPDDYLPWLPVVYMGERLAPTHAVWASLGGATIGLGLLTRSRGAIWLPIAASGSLVAAMDHIANNLVDNGGDLYGFLNLLTLDGWLVIGLFLATALGCVGADLAIQRRRGPKRDEAPARPGMAGLGTKWSGIVIRRRLAIADFHWHQLPSSKRREPAAEGVRVALADVLLATHERRTLSAGDEGPTDAASGSGGAAPARHDDVMRGPPAPPAAGALVLIGLVGAGSLGLAALGEVGGSAGCVSFLSALDVGANCDGWCLVTGGGGAGGAGSPDEDGGLLSDIWQIINDSPAAGPRYGPPGMPPRTLPESFLDLGEDVWDVFWRGDGTSLPQAVLDVLTGDPLGTAPPDQTPDHDASDAR
jgi:RsiW-degrading membrane proteinase PrsW (M82 family)